MATASPPPYMQTPDHDVSYPIQPTEQHELQAHESGMAEAKQSYYSQAPEGHPAQYQQQQEQSQQPTMQQSYSQQNINAPQNQPQGPNGRPAGPLTPLDRLNVQPALVDCPVCGQRQVTRTEFESGNTTFGWAAGLCICVGLGCIPFCINGTKNVAHYCGHEGTRLATWHRSGRTEVHVVPRA